MSTTGVDAGYYESRFPYDSRRDRVWKAIIAYLVRRGLLARSAVVLELGAGYCHFINNVPAARKFAVDTNPQARQWASAGVELFVQQCSEPLAIPTGSIDVVFASNLFEHLPRTDLDRTVLEIRRVLKPRGRLIIIQPNYRYAYREYFDDYTHVAVFSHLSLVDYLSAQMFRIQHVEPRFIPFSMRSSLPKAGWLVSLYLRSPWRPTAGQMLVVCEAPDAHAQR